MRRAALPVLRPLPARRALPGVPRVRRRGRRARLRLRRGVRRRAGARQRGAAAPGGHPVVRRGRRLAGPDRAVRHARAAALAGPDRPRRSSALALVAGPGPDLRRPTAVGAGERASSQPMPWRELAFLSWAGLRGAVPIVLATIPLAEGVDDADRLFDIVFVMVVIYTLLTGPTLPWVARVLQGGPAVRAARPRGRGGAAGADRRRPAAGHDQPGVADARRRGRRAAAARRAPRSSLVDPRRQTSWCPSAVRSCGTATTCWSSPRASCGSRPRSGCARCPRAAGWPSGSGRAETADAAEPAQLTGGLQISASSVGDRPPSCPGAGPRTRRRRRP